LHAFLSVFAQEHDLNGLILLSSEGLNGTISISPENLAKFQNHLRDQTQTADLTFKDSVAPKHPFQIFKIKIKEEIVTLGRPDLVPQTPHNRHLSPQQWQAKLDSTSPILIDTRNDYEVDIGKFKGAVDFRTREFHEFPERLKKSGIPAEQEILIYCTGGIRCEKAILAMEEQGYRNVYQLDGGILNYLKEFPDRAFEGECFVFDYRVAVDQNLEPTARYSLCPHCGQPANSSISCVQCGTSATICTRCLEAQNTTCSKNCAHHLSIGSGSKQPHRQELTKRHRL